MTRAAMLVMFLKEHRPLLIRLQPLRPHRKVAAAL
jgi:hypothetical protein